ncbi:hypothetical protein H9P43_008406 [Blastocladiella emersonii ATCC 22665]|nr:hypothetical protein H9P43_008406 [Blastocladiella emersonii ATCC 22665]
MGFLPYLVARVMFQWDFDSFRLLEELLFNFEGEFFVTLASSESGIELLLTYINEPHHSHYAAIILHRKDPELIAAVHAAYGRSSRPAAVVGGDGDGDVPDGLNSEEVDTAEFEEELAESLSRQYLTVDQMRRFANVGIGMQFLLTQQFGEALLRRDRAMFNFAKEVLDQADFQSRLRDQASEFFMELAEPEIEPVRFGLTLALENGIRINELFDPETVTLDDLFQRFPAVTQDLVSPPLSHDPAAVFVQLFNQAFRGSRFLETTAALHLADLTVFVLNSPEHHAAALHQISGVDDMGLRGITSFYLDVLIIKHAQSPSGPSLEHLPILLYLDAPATWTPWRYALHTVLAMYPSALKQSRLVDARVPLQIPPQTFLLTDDTLQARLATEAADPAFCSWTMPTMQLLVEELLPVNAKWVCRDLLNLTESSPPWKRDLVPVAFRDMDWSEDTSNHSDDTGSLASSAKAIIAATTPGP